MFNSRFPFSCFIKDAYICNFDDDNSLYSIEDNFKEVKTMLKLRRTLNF